MDLNYSEGSISDVLKSISQKVLFNEVNSVKSAAKLFDGYRRIMNSKQLRKDTDFEAGEMEEIKVGRGLPTKIAVGVDTVIKDLSDDKKYIGNVLSGKIIDPESEYSSQGYIQSYINTLAKCVKADLLRVMDDSIPTKQILEEKLEQLVTIDNSPFTTYRNHNADLSIDWCIYEAFDMLRDCPIALYAIPYFSGHGLMLSVDPDIGIYVFGVQDQSLATSRDLYADAQDYVAKEKEKLNQILASEGKKPRSVNAATQCDSKLKCYVDDRVYATLIAHRTLVIKPIQLLKSAINKDSKAFRWAAGQANPVYHYHDIQKED